jgi:hypothetical protein
MNTKIITTIGFFALALSSAHAMDMMASTSQMMKKDAMDTTTMKKDMTGDAMMKKDMSTYASFDTNLGMGQRGESVAMLQTFLIDTGYLVLPSGATKGYFGGLTKKALMMYQESEGISATGYFGPKTRMHFQEKSMKMKDTMKKDGMTKDAMTQ